MKRSEIRETAPPFAEVRRLLLELSTAIKLSGHTPDFAPLNPGYT